MNFIHVDGLALLNNMFLIPESIPHSVESRQHFVQLGLEIGIIRYVVVVDEGVVVRKMVVDLFDIEIRSPVFVHFIHKTGYMIVVGVCQDPCGDMPSSHIFFQQRHIQRTASVYNDAVVLFGYDHKSHHEFAGFCQHI